MSQTSLKGKLLIFFLVSISMLAIIFFWYQANNFQGLKQIDFESNFTGFNKMTATVNDLKSQISNLYGEVKVPNTGKIISEREYNYSQTKNNVNIILRNIVFKEQETWVYLFIQNQNEQPLILPATSDFKIIQAEGEVSGLPAEKVFDYPLQKEIAGHNETLGALHFSPIDNQKPFILTLTGLKILDQAEQMNFVFKIE